jgi:DNA-binding GntR family transcriptional regulator
MRRLRRPFTSGGRGRTCLGLLDRIHRIRSYYGQRFTQRRLHEILAEHAAMLDAIVEGDAERAEQAVQRHLRNAGAFLIGLAGPERQ